MISYIVTATLGGLWVHYTSRFFRFGPPTVLSAFLSVAIGVGLAIVAFVQVLTRPGLVQWSGDVVFAAITFVSLFLSLSVLLRDQVTKASPTPWVGAGLAATTTALLSLPAVLFSIFPDAEA